MSISNTNIFLSPDEFCEEFPHNLIPTPGYWIECSRQKIASDTIWDESESERDEDGRLEDTNGEENGLLEHRIKNGDDDCLLENDEGEEEDEEPR
jgi:AAA ATPase containing von Willebrand factor type A (vWA) domain